ncbi:MAG: enoyl-CoA hydratase [Gammaproteobacteria bacterium]|nr:enoyl-CoA hydratase [Gammaproteobacteria bacterium]
MADSLVLVERDDGLATVTLNRPEALNAMSGALRAELVAALTTLANEEQIGVVILTGAGRAFSAGLDLKELGSASAPRSDSAEHDVVSAMDAFDKPIIGAINGFAITGGFEVALACDLLIASSKARFADTHARVGIVPGWGLSQRLPRMIGIHRAKELSLTGNYLDAETAEAWGLVNRVVAPEALMDTARSLARDMLSCDQPASREILRIMDEGWNTTLGGGLEIETAANRARPRTTNLEARRLAVQKRGREQASH